MKAPDFAGASREVLSFLHQRIGMELWMVSRADNEDWVVLTAEDHGYGVKQGDVFRWADTFCSRMVRGDGPRIAPCAIDVPAYADLPFTRQLPIGAYVGVPLVDGEGQLFGTLCGLNPRPMPAGIMDEQPMVEVLADMLSGLLTAELNTTALTREAEAARSEALTDPLTGLANRRGWETALAAEEERCRRYGATACVVAVELDGLKSPCTSQAQREACDAVLVRAAQALRQTVRKPDTLARLDDDRFVVLGVECTTAEAMALLRRLELGVQGAELSAALGMAMRNRTSGLFDTYERAIDAMVEHRDARARD
ncbi:sensor domain-containing diguanylate cyclase [Scleromatobacter humisilvae]|uniref:diguanylate cyclase n=1 Tax=Scleromatobacter humisilvae TaxID=2897159 RepID=A0A9X1YMT3_9BURK|nr:sensor domain-containing diguanylate cyclase [Scleromatobacter humisilvae]MCK9684411.1 sensor domain-containing diguanylate cyclase [Scleromatobacter humisilvae]